MILRKLNKTKKNKTEKIKQQIICSNFVTLPYELIPKHVKVFTLKQFPISENLLLLFKNYSKNIDSPDLIKRTLFQNLIRGKDENYFMGQGSVFSKFIIQNRTAINQLIGNIGDSTILIAPERGGGLVLDHINNGLPYGIKSIKIPKFSEEVVYESELDDAIQELQQYPWSKIFYKKNFTEKKVFIKPIYSKNEHAERLEKTIEWAMQTGHKNIALIDTMVSGISACHLINSAGKILSKYPDAVRFNLLIHQHTLEIDMPYGHPKAYPLPYEGGCIKIYPKLKFDIKALKPNFSGRSKEEKKELSIRWKNKKNESYGEITVANGNNRKSADFNNILGEDVAFQLLEADISSNAFKPFCVFTLGLDDNIKVLVFQPSGGLTAKNTLEMLISGYFDCLLREYKILPPEENKLSPTIDKSNYFTREPSLFSYASENKNFGRISMGNQKNIQRTPGHGSGNSAKWKKKIRRMASANLDWDGHTGNVSRRQQGKHPLSFFALPSRKDTKVFSNVRSDFNAVIFSLDFDGCLDSVFKDKNKYSQFKAYIIQHIESMIEKNPDEKIKIEILLGTQRQSIAEEFRMLMGGSSMCPSTYLRFTEDLNEVFENNRVQINLNKFLLGDMFKNLESGSTFNQMMELEKENKPNLDKKIEKIEKSARLCT